MAKTLNPEDLIRTYLRGIEDPTSLVDLDQIQSLEAAARNATDPIDKLRALAALNKAKSPDVDQYRQAFVQYARAWAEDNDIPAAVFTEVGVSHDVLRSAGLITGRSRDHVRTQSKRASMSVVDIMTALRRRNGVFTLADVAREIGGSPMTVRKAVEKLVSSGEIARLGPTPDWTGRGRAPLQFRRT